MPTIFDPASMANIKDATAALVGVAQVRVASYTSVRDAVTVPAFTAGTALIPVGKSTTFTDATDGTTKIVKPATVAAANAASTNPTVSGSYTGNYDGCFILVVDSPTVCSLYAPDGTRTAGTIATGTITLTPAVQGLTFTGTATGCAAGDTWILPVISPTAQAGTQTGIITPYSMFRGAANSVGGLKDASWDPKIDSISTLESGFPSTINDQIISKLSASMKFSAYEFTGAAVAVLRDMLNSAMNGDIIAAAAEIVFRDRKGGLVTYWCPSCTLIDAPSIAPQNDFSTVPWNLRVNKQTEAGATGARAAWLRNMSMYYELTYTH